MFDDFYGLTGKPFQLTPDPAFYFRSITHRKASSIRRPMTVRSVIMSASCHNA